MSHKLTCNLIPLDVAGKPVVIDKADMALLQRTCRVAAKRTNRLKAAALVGRMPLDEMLEAAYLQGMADAVFIAR